MKPFAFLPIHSRRNWSSLARTAAFAAFATAATPAFAALRLLREEPVEAHVRVEFSPLGSRSPPAL